MKSPLLTRLSKRDSGHSGRVSEKKVAQRIGGQLTPASGAKQEAKGDIRKGDFLIEAKSTKAESLILKKEWLLKIYQEALEVSKNPACAISFTDDSGKSEKRERWVMVPEHIWQELVD